MIKANYHTHCSYCDGTGVPEDFVKEAVVRKMTALGFSCHAPLPFPNVFTMAAEMLGEYVATVQELKRKHAGDIRLYLGLEIDFIPGIETFQSSFSALGLDYSIGSVHYVDADEHGNPWAIDADPATFVNGMTGVYHGNGRAAVERYYALVREMVQEARHDMVGHLDIIKKNNGAGRFFSEDEPWYDEAVKETLALIAEKSRIVEVNTAGLRKRVGLYPSVDILKRCKEFNILLTVNSDAHQPSDIDSHYSEVRELLLSMGYEEIYQLTPNGWEASPLE